MGLALLGGEGPLKDQVFALSEGLTLGRTGAGIEINDGLVSSIHARIYQNDQKNWVLADNNSKNGVRIKGERISFIELQPGVSFEIGGQAFKVIDTAPAKAPAAEPATPPQKTQRYWHELLIEFLQGHSKEFVDDGRDVTPLTPAVVLEFIRGVQAKSKWVLGYGPRAIGADSVDLPILEPGAPAVCFEIDYSVDGIVFKTAHPKLVRLNDQEVDSRVLSVGDTIKIMETIIEVDFVE